MDTPAARAQGKEAGVLVLDPEGRRLADVRLSGGRVSVGRLPGENDIVLGPDPERLVSRVGHCTFERDRGRWIVVDGGGVNGTFVRRGSSLERVSGRRALEDGDVVCILGALEGRPDRRYFELVFQETGDAQATRAAPAAPGAAPAGACLSYEEGQARLVLVRGRERQEIQVRAQAHRLVRHMAERNEAIGGSPALCTHEELIRAVWSDEPLHTRAELAKLVWELRRALEPFGAGELIESERRRGYRLRTCARDE
jgi:FHA domain/Transcriptional regulatory protein, C terminal